MEFANELDRLRFEAVRSKQLRQRLAGLYDRRDGLAGDDELFELWHTYIDIDIAERELKGLDGCEQRYEEAYERKLRAIKASGGTAAGRLDALERERTELLQLNRDAANAVHDAETAISAGKMAYECISDAVAAGEADLYRDSVLDGAAKSALVAEAREHMEQLRVALRFLDAGLGSLGEGLLDEALDGAVSLVERFFDGVDVPLLETCSLEDAAARACLVTDCVEGVLRRVEQVNSDALSRLAELDEEYERFVIEYEQK